MSRDRQAAVHEVGTALQRYQRATQAFDDAVGRALGLGAADLRCLDWLSEGPKTAGELAVATGLRPAATTALIDRLERKNYVRRTHAPDDRRRVLVEYTDEGRQRIMRAYGPLAEEGPRLLAGLSDDELHSLARLLDTMTATTDAHRGRHAGLGAADTLGEGSSRPSTAP